MALAAGTTIGPYEILAAIGAGGMGEVYRARDTHLKREVAIKVLPEAFAQDPDRLARFQREAETLAALNHPHIAHIHGLEEANGVRALVMELVEGEDLARRIARGPLAIDEALPIARQIADALEAAHEKGVIHRDLKPANIMATSEDQVKVLDFGLAKATGPAEAGQHDDPRGVRLQADLTRSPTLTMPAMLTGAGVILGTAGYMSPEQAKGRAADKRSDVWAFGCVLFEMLTGRRAFEGADIADTLAAILRGEPDWRALPEGLPAAIHRLLHHCLTKDRKNRLADLADARFEIADATAAPVSEAPAFAPRSWWRRPAFVAIASSVVTSLMVGLAVWAVARNSRDASTASAVRFAIHDSDRVTVSRQEGDVALSPDGRTLAFVGFSEGGRRIFVRAIDALEARALPGTEDAESLCWSPDGQSLAFTAVSRVKTLVVSGGAPEVLGPIRVPQGMALTWGPDGAILFADRRGVWRAQGHGGAPAKIVSSSSDEPVASPEFLPDGRHFLLAVGRSGQAKAGTFVVTLDGTTRTRLLDFPTAARYAAGRLLFVRERELYAQAFDLSRLLLVGAAAPLAENVAQGFSASTNGAVAYLPTLMAVPVRPTTPIEFGPPAALFQFFATQKGFPLGQKPPYDVTADGQRFIVSAVVRRTDPSILVLLNWPSLVAG